MHKFPFRDSSRIHHQLSQLLYFKKKNQQKQKKKWAFQVFYNKYLGSVHANSEPRKEAVTSTEYDPLLGINQH